MESDEMNADNAGMNIDNAGVIIHKGGLFFTMALFVMSIMSVMSVDALAETRKGAECMALDKVSVLVGYGGGSEIQLSRSPAAFSQFSWPAGITVYGQVVRARGYLGHAQLLLESDKNTDDMRSSLVASFKQQGWSEATSKHRHGGFVSAQIPTMTGLCHKTLGSIHFFVDALDKGSFARVSLLDKGKGGLCEPQRDRWQGRLMGKLQENIPQLNIPDELQLPSMRSGSGGNSERMSSSTGLKRIMPMDDVMQLFDDQMVSQGWTNDTDWQGGIASGSVWRKPIKDEPDLMATLLLQSNSDNTYRLTLDVTWLSQKRR